MVTITYDALNDLVLKVVGAIEETTGIGHGLFDLGDLNSALTSYLEAYGVQFEDREEEEDDSIYGNMIRSGVLSAVVRYSGSGDEGYIEDSDFDPPIANRVGETDAERNEREHALEKLLHDAAYDILEKRFPGWEINEGSEGTITFDAGARTTKLHHGARVEITEWHDFVEV